VLVALAVAVSDGATTISEIAVLGDEAELFGSGVSASTGWRLLDRLDHTALALVAAARARARRSSGTSTPRITGGEPVRWSV
jgi:hypothetical protein